MMTHIITKTGDLAQLADSLLQEPCIALDSEGNSFHRYPEQVCLIQIATESESFVIDPLAVEDMSSFGRLLAERGVLKTLHGGDYDIRSFNREWGFVTHGVFDSNIAARFLSLEQFRLDAVLLELLGVTIPKDKHIQTADWSRRPLSEESLAYAVGDVVHLHRLHEEMTQRLEALGRLAWVAEECARLEEVRYSPPEPPEITFLSIKGSRDLDGRGLAVLRELAILREAEARRRGIPPFRVLHDSVLVFLSGVPETKLTEVPGLHVNPEARFGVLLREALRRGVEAPSVRRPPPPFDLLGKPTPEQKERFRMLKEWRTEWGEDLKVDPSLIWPMASLERLSRAPETFREEMHAPAVRNWQRAGFADSLRERLAAS